jgi:hypothetical protein
VVQLVLLERKVQGTTGLVVQLVWAQEYKVLLEQLELLEQLDYLEQLVHGLWCNWFCWHKE